MVEKIKVALVGIGNCFSGLIQGIEYYRQNPSQQVIGIIHEKLRDYGIYDICLLYTSPSPRDKRQSRMPSSA